MITRRGFLIGASAAAAGLAGGVVLTGRAPFEPQPAAAAADEKFKYHGRDVAVTPTGDTVHITVNGSHGIHVEREGNEFVTHLLPFSSFKTPRQLVQAVIDAEDATLLII
jgi:hypothetical protein